MSQWYWMRYLCTEHIFVEGLETDKALKLAGLTGENVKCHIGLSYLLLFGPNLCRFLFLAHLILQSDVLLLSKVRNLNISRKLWGRVGRPWEAVLLWLAQTDLTANQGSTASHGLSIWALGGRFWAVGGRIRPPKHSASHILSCDLSEPIRGARPLTHTASQTVRPICEAVGVRSPIGLSRTLAESPILGAIWLISRLNALPHTVDLGLTDRPHRSDSQICEAVGVRGGRPWEAEHGLSDRSHDFVVRGHGSPSTASQIWESDLWGRSASHAHRAMQCV